MFVEHLTFVIVRVPSFGGHYYFTVGISVLDVWADSGVGLSVKLTPWVQE